MKKSPIVEHIKPPGMNHRDWKYVTEACHRANEGQALAIIRKLLHALTGESDQIINDILMANCWRIKLITDSKEGKSVTIYRKKDMQITWEEKIETEEQEGRCKKCGHTLTGKDYTNEYEDRGEHFGAPVQEAITVGYTCSKCGYTKKF